MLAISHVMLNIHVYYKSIHIQDWISSYINSMAKYIHEIMKTYYVMKTLLSGLTG